MDRRSWYQQYPNQYPPQNPMFQSRNVASHASMAADFPQLQGAGYAPHDSTTPTSSPHRGSRHPDSSNLVAPMSPMYNLPQYYTPQSGNSQPYTGYSDVGMPFMPYGRTGKESAWEATHDNAHGQMTASTPGGMYTPAIRQQWNPHSYNTNSVPLIAATSPQRTPLPYMSSSSSSLALALGDPSKPPSSSRAPAPPPPPPPPPPPLQPQPQFALQYQSRDSHKHMSSFPTEPQFRSSSIYNPPSPTLVPSTPSRSEMKTPVRVERDILEIDKQKQHGQSLMSSPDPLLLTSPVPLLTLASRYDRPQVPPEESPAFTPRRRKPDEPQLLLPEENPTFTPRKRKPDELQSPTIKRVHSFRGLSRQNSKSSVVSTPGSGEKPRKNISVFVEVPSATKKWATPSTTGRSKTKSVPSSMDLGGFSPPPESEWDDDHKSFRTGSKSSGKRTGDRDDRAPLEKLTAFVEDIFEAEESLPPDADLEALPKDWFSLHTVDAARPLLAHGVVRKLTKLTSQIARPHKRMRLARDVNKQGKGGLSEMEPAVLGRLLKLLERGVKAGEDVDPFRCLDHQKVVTPVKSAPSGNKKGKIGKNSSKAKGKEPPTRGRDGGDSRSARRSRSRSRTPTGEEQQGGAVGEPDAEGGEAREDGSVELTERDFQKLEKALEIAKESVIAADCCVALLAADKLPKQLYSEELITACFATIKNQLTKVIYPFVEATSDVHGHGAPILLHVARNTDISSQFYRREIGETFQALTAVLPRMSCLVGSDVSVAMSDAIVIQAVYIAIGPFFVVEPGIEGKGKKESANSLVLNALGGKGAMRALRLEALSLIRNIFANHEDQRSWIIEEILTSLIKLPDLKQKSGQFRLRDGRSIHTVSALLLQLVQTSAHDVRIQAKRLEFSRQQSFIMKHDNQVDAPSESFLTDRDYDELKLYNSGLDSASKAAKTIVVFLTQRSGKGKVIKSSNEAEYRAIFDNLILDLLTVLYWPEWPAAALLLRIICMFMVNSLSEKTSNNNIDNNAAKTVALDHLGIIAARLVTSSLKFKDGARGSDGPLKSLDEILARMDHDQLNRIINVHQEVSNHLSKRSSEDQACDSARELAAVTWGHELATAVTHFNSILRKMEEEGAGSDFKKYRKLAEKVKSALRNVWKESSHDVFDIGSQEDVERVDRLSEELGTIQSLKNAFDPILNVILASLDSAAVFMRTKALRALGQIVTADPGILRNVNVRTGIETHLLDSSPQVRDAAVELIGKYVFSMPEVAGEYYEQIAERIADTGLAVRKRVIKLLRTFYGVSSQHERRVDICLKLVLRMHDEDETVRDLAMKTLEEIWFSETTQPDSPTKGNVRNGSTPSEEKSKLLQKVSVIMGVSSYFRDRQSPLEELLHKVITDKEGKDSHFVHDRYRDIGNALIDCLVDAQELPGFSVVNCIRTIYLFVSAYPSIISTHQATTLLPYLKNATTAEEQLTSDYLLKIFRVSTPGMSKTASKFAHELQSILQQMMMKPVGPNWVVTLQETVACLCTVVHHLTHDFHLLVALVKSCNARLKEHLARPKDQVLDMNTKKRISLQVFIVSLLCEHSDFDKLRNENAVSTSELDSVSPDSVTEHIYGLLLRMYDKYDDPMIRARFLECLGFLFRAYPSLMTHESSATIMDAIFASPEEEARGRLLKIMQDFLITESTKHSAQEKAAQKNKNVQSKVNMEELVGNTDGFADSGVSSAIVQRYLPQILEAAVTKNVQMQAAAVDILGFTIKQGLAHPLQCLPVIVALETSPNANLSNRTGVLHAILYNKHHSLMNTRHLECARASFTYQRLLCSGVVCGYRMSPTPTALLHRWYALVREKRASRQDFLKTMIKVFDIDSTKLSSTQDDVDFIRYMAENMSAFDYKTQEEVLTVIHHLTAVLSVVGMALVETIAPTTLNGSLPEEGFVSAPTKTGINGDPTLPARPASAVLHHRSANSTEVARCSLSVGIVLLLKSHLKTLYGLTEDKCSKWVPGKKSALGDRPATKRREMPLVLDRLPYAAKAIITAEDAALQNTNFLELWAEDPVTAEPPEDDPMEAL